MQGRSAHPDDQLTDGLPAAWLQEGGGVESRYAYFYLMQDDPDRVGATVPRHVAHWHELQLPDYLDGPFADRTGGLITFQADDDQQAQRAVDADPFVREGLLMAHWLKQWSPQ
jgi:uncharacterized protein YciI